MKSGRWTMAAGTIRQIDATRTYKHSYFSKIGDCTEAGLGALRACQAQPKEIVDHPLRTAFRILPVDFELVISQVLEGLSAALRYAQDLLLGVLLLLQVGPLPEENLLGLIERRKARALQAEFGGCHAGLELIHKARAGLGLLAIQGVRLLVDLIDAMDDEAQAQPLTLLQALSQTKNRLQREVKGHGVSREAPGDRRGSPPEE